MDSQELCPAPIEIPNGQKKAVHEGIPSIDAADCQSTSDQLKSKCLAPPDAPSPARASTVACSDATENEADPAVLRSSTPEERRAAIELETAATKAAASWPRPGPLAFKLEAEDGRARAGLLQLPHGTVETPIFMPVGTNGALKGVHLGLLHCIDKERTAQGGPPRHENTSPPGSAKDVSDDEAREEELPRPPSWFSNLILGNTFHLYRQVGGGRMREVGKGLHRFMRWGANLLTDSGGFQMVSLCRLMDVFEEGVCFRLGPNGLKKESKRKREHSQRNRPKADDQEPIEGNAEKDADEIVLLTPEESIFMQNQIGSDIIMQLDDVIASTTPDPQRVEDAMLRSIRWLDRCILAHDTPESQALFGIVQGGLDLGLRERALALFKKRGCHGTAIGGLSGGERKSDFWQVVCLCTSEDKGLPREKPRYLMGVGYAIDIVMSVALGCDMFDCVFPCRTARFGTAITRTGSIRIKQSKYALDLRPLDSECDCYTCLSYSRAFLHFTFNKSPTTGQLLTLHNLYYMQQLCSEMRQSIKEKRFADFVQRFLLRFYPRQTPEEGQVGTDHSEPVAKRRKVASTGADSTPEGACSGECTENANVNHEVNVITSSDFNTDNAKASEGPKPPEWVRDALLAAGIDIRHLYTSFDPNE